MMISLEYYIMTYKIRTHLYIAVERLMTYIIEKVYKKKILFKHFTDFV